MVDKLNHIDMEDTWSDVSVIHRKLIPIPIGDSSIQNVSPDLVVDVQVHHQQGEVKGFLFWSLASAFHHLRQKHTGSALASMAKKFCNLLARDQLKVVLSRIMKGYTRR